MQPSAPEPDKTTEDDVPELPGLPALDFLPDLPELGDFFGPPKSSCGICDFLEEHVCKPYATKGSPRECAEEIKATRDTSIGRPREERVAALTKIFEKYGIDPNIRLEGRGT